MKLSERTSLSGRPEFEKQDDAGAIFERHFGPKRFQVGVQTSAVALPPKRCVSCGLQEVIHETEGEPDSNIAAEYRFLQAASAEMAKRMITPPLRAKGWSYVVHVGRHAMMRHMCRPCLMAHREIREEFERKRSNELKAQQAGDGYYAALCGD